MKLTDTNKKQKEMNRHRFIDQNLVKNTGKNKKMLCTSGDLWHNLGGVPQQ